MMDDPARHFPSFPTGGAVALTAALLLTFSLPNVAASGWTQPKRVFDTGSTPRQSMARDGGGGAVHIATERGSDGIWYVTNASGSWQECRVTSANDREPSLAVSSGMVHIAFARYEADGRGIYTSSGPGDCSWSTTVRYRGGARQPALAARGATLSLAFKNSARKLRFMKGPHDATAWTIRQTVDSDCCTSPPALALTHKGAPRLAYGDGTRRQNGLKYAVRTNSGWKKTKVARGRVKHVALVLDQTPGLFGQPPSDGPHIAFAVKKRGTYLAAKGTSGVAGGWSKRFLGRSSGPVDVTHSSSLTQVVHTKAGRILHARHSGGIWWGSQVTGSGSDTHPQLEGGVLTFARGKGSPGVYYVRQK